MVGNSHLSAIVDASMILEYAFRADAELPSLDPRAIDLDAVT